MSQAERYVAGTKVQKVQRYMVRYSSTPVHGCPMAQLGLHEHERACMTSRTDDASDGRLTSPAAPLGPCIMRSLQGHEHTIDFCVVTPLYLRGTAYDFDR